MLPLYHYPRIHFIGEYPDHCYRRPFRGRLCLEAGGIMFPKGFFIFHRGKHSKPVKPLRNGLCAHPVDLPRKYFPDDPGGIPVRGQPVLVFHRLQISVHGKRPYEFPLLPFCLLVALYLLGDIPAVRIIDKILYRQDK